jgi:hypothetical protein
MRRRRLASIALGLATLPLGCGRIEAMISTISTISGFGDDPPPAISAPPRAATAPDDAPAPDAPAAAPAVEDPAGSVARMVAKMEAAKPKFPAYAVVRDGARMFIAPNKAGGHFVAGGDDAPPPGARYRYWGPAGPPAATEPTGRAVQIVGVSGDMFEIETVTTEDAAVTCAPLQPELSRIRTHLWVERTALVPVLEHPVTVALDEHATVTLGPGVPAFETEEEGVFRIVAGDIQMRVPLPENPPGRWHDAPAPFETTGAVGTLGAWYNMTLAGSAFPPDGPTGRQQGQLYGDINGNTWLFADEIVDGDSRVRVRNRCLDAEGVVVTDPRSAAPTSLVPATAARRPQDQPPHVLAGSRLRWEDGSDAGVAVAPIFFSGSERVAGQDTCFSISTDADSPQLCMSTTELEASPAKRSEDGLVLTASTGWAAATPYDVAIVDQMWEHSEPMRECFRKRIGKKPGYNYGSANLNLKIGIDGTITNNWGSAWSSRGSSTAMQTCLEDITKGFAITPPPPAPYDVALNMSVTRR